MINYVDTANDPTKYPACQHRSMAHMPHLVFLTFTTFNHLNTLIAIREVLEKLMVIDKHHDKTVF